jgi:hypothetical protein
MIRPWDGLSRETSQGTAKHIIGLGVQSLYGAQLATRRYGTRGEKEAKKWKESDANEKRDRRHAAATRETRANTVWGQSPLYAASHNPRGRSREVHFRNRARGAKIRRFEEGGERSGRKDAENVSDSSEMEARA